MLRFAQSSVEEWFGTSSMCQVNRFYCEPPRSTPAGVFASVLQAESKRWLYASRKSWFPIAVTVTVAVDSLAETIWAHLVVHFN